MIAVIQATAAAPPQVAMESVAVAVVVVYVKRFMLLLILVKLEYGQGE